MPVMQAALEGAGEAMDRAAGLLDNDQTGEHTVTAQRAAEKRLRAVVESSPRRAPATSRRPPPDHRGRQKSHNPRGRDCKSRRN